ncbi:MAG TPA: VanZ family protein [Herbaspirillum sp.]
MNQMQVTDAPAAPAATSPPSSSPFSRAALLAYAFLIVYASWYPFSGWRDLGIHPLAFLGTPFPYYRTSFDIATNVAGYAPFGLLLVLAMHPRLKGLLAVLAATLTAALMSCVMEAVQTYLPTRVSSNLDLCTNTAGALLGALAGAGLRYRLLESSRLLDLRQRWINDDVGRGLVVVGLWPLAQIYPISHFFGLGQLFGALSSWLSALMAEPIDLATLLFNGLTLSSEQYWLSEVVITACGLIGGVLTLLVLLRKSAPRLRLSLALVGAALLVKIFASALFFAPENAFISLTPATLRGLLIGAGLLLPMAFLPFGFQRRIASFALIVGIFIINLLPPNPYFISTLQTWVQGKFLNFNGAAQFLSVAWPFFALWFLRYPVRRKKV